jgi:transposase
MRRASNRIPESAEKTVRDIRRATRRHHSAEEKIRIVLEGLRGEVSIAELCRKEGINQNLYYRWSKEFLEAGKKRLAGDTAREATSDEVKELKAGFAVLGIRTALLLVTYLLLTACVVSPLSRTNAESPNGVRLKGYTLTPGQAITIQAVDQNTGNLDTRGTATAATSGTSYKTASGTSYTLYPWSFDAGVLPANFWSPQSIVADLATSQGHLEMFALVGSSNFLTFSEAAAASALTSGKDPATDALHFSDGNSTVLFDASGVGSGPETPWVTVQGMISDSHSPYYSAVAWSVGYYTVEGGKKIYGLICAPTTGGPYPVVIYNHGGTDKTNGGNITGIVTAAGWTTQPPGAPDGLGQCVDWAKRGWIFATSSYRGESVNITSSSPEFPSSTWTSDGNVEFCMGEVTDVLALTDLLVNHASAITLGSTSEKVPINANGKVLMYGYSHGGCITYRAVEQGAPVTAFSVIEGFTDLRLTYLTGLSAGLSPEFAAIGSGAFQPGVSFYLPDANGVMGYNWRSAHYFASRGDLSIQKFKTMPILILHGDIDAGNLVEVPAVGVVRVVRLLIRRVAHDANLRDGPGRREAAGRSGRI